MTDPALDPPPAAAVREATNPATDAATNPATDAATPAAMDAVKAGTDAVDPQVGAGTDEAGPPVGAGTDAAVDAATEMALLRRFEPVLRLTSGELFLPGPIEDYLAHAALVKDTGRAEQVLAEAGTLTPAGLAGLGKRHTDEALWLRYVG